MITVCIPTMPGRESTLSRLLHNLQPHVGDDLEVLVHRRVAPMGDKLNEMFAAATGSHVVCVDDDDVLHAGLIPRTPVQDFVGWRVLVQIDGQTLGDVEHRLGQDPGARWSSRWRGVSPKCLVRTEIARSVPFGNEYTADRAWSTEVQSRCETGMFIDEIVYVYDHWSSAMLGTNPGDKPDALQRDVGWWQYTPGRFTWLA